MSRDNCPGGAWQDSSVAPESFISSPAELRGASQTKGYEQGWAHTGTEGTFFHLTPCCSQYVSLLFVMSELGML